jgi:hypothetical protein
MGGGEKGRMEEEIRSVLFVFGTENPPPKFPFPARALRFSVFGGGHVTAFTVLLCDPEVYFSGPPQFYRLGKSPWAA